MEQKINKYPSGKCDYCWEVFERPNKFQTETEEYHITGCRLSGIENAINNNEELGDIQELIDEVERISKVSSFGASNKLKNKYNERMKYCTQIVKRLKELNSH